MNNKEKNKELQELCKIPLDEKETIIHVDYFSKKMNIYTTRFATSRKLNTIFENTNLIEYDNKKNFPNEWNIPFEQRQTIKKALSLSTLLPSKKDN